MQFNLRTLMLATAAVAVCAAAIAPFFRQLSELTQTRLVLIIGSLAITNLFSLAVVVLIDTEIRRIAGKCFVSIRNHERMGKVMALVWCLLAFANIAMLIQHINYKTGEGCGIYEVLYDCYAPMLMLTYWLPTTLLNWRMTQLQFCANGLVNNAFIPASKIGDPCWKNGRLYLTFTGRHKVSYAIPAVDRPAVEHVLKHWCFCNTAPAGKESNGRRIIAMVVGVFAIPLALIVARGLLPAPTRAPRVRTTTTIPALPTTTPAPSASAR
jgi:hypothetical protein